MKFSTVSLLAVIFASTPCLAALERSFTDDSGITHTTSLEKPTIVTFAHTATSLFDYGLGTDQLLGTYGEYVVTGSDFDFDEPGQASSFNADPEPNDIAMLQKTENLSPECERTPGYCTSFEADKLVDLDPDYLIVHGYADSPWGFSNFTEQVLAVFPETKIIYNDVSLRGDDCQTHENCYGISMIDLIEKYRELAAFLNLEEPAQLSQDYADLCSAATEFSATMKVAHDKGIRTMAAYVDPSTAFYASPVDDIVLRMFEELGMPILHIGKCEDCSLNYFWESIPTESYFASCTDEQINATDFESCNDNPLYPVDVWLYDHRTRAVVNSEDFPIVFPDLALMNGQFVEWPIGGRKITPRHAVEILNSVGPAVAGSSRIHDETTCVPGLNVTSQEHRQSGSGVKGAGAGEYSCYNPDYHNTKYLQGCAAVKETADKEKSGACYDMSTHECSCDPGRCTEELCVGNSGVWTDRCPNHCTSCSDEEPATPSNGDSATPSVSNGEKKPVVNVSPTFTADGDEAFTPFAENPLYTSAAVQTVEFSVSAVAFSMAVIFASFH